jgi:ankyrin repeat protein
MQRIMKLLREKFIKHAGTPARDLLYCPPNPEQFSILLRMTSMKLSFRPDKRRLNPTPEKQHAQDKNNSLMLQKMASWMRLKKLFCRARQCVRNMVGGLRGRAAQKGHESVVKFLVENGADLSARMDVGWGIFPGDGPALTWPAGGGHLEVVRYLATRGANLDIQA